MSHPPGAGARTAAIPHEEEGREEELESFHRVLGDISMGTASNEVRKFIIDSYVRGAKIGNAEAASFEGNTAVSWGQTHTSTSPPPQGRM